MQKKLWNKDFILLLQGSSVSAIGDLMYSVAIGYWVYEKTGSSGLMGIMSSISMFVRVFLSPFSGSVVDKCNRKWLMVGIDVLQGLLMLGVGVLAWQNALSVPVVLIAALVAAFGSVFYSPAVSTLMLDLIPRDDMVRGQSVQSGLSSLINLVSKALSGVMVAFLGVPLIVVINGLSNLYSALTEAFVHVPETVQQGQRVTVKGIFRDTVCAIRTVFADDCLRLFIPFVLLLNLLCSGPMSLMLPFCMEKGFSVDMYGYLMAVTMAGSLLCVLVLGVVKLRPEARFLVMAIGFIAGVVLFVAAYFCVEFVPVCVLFFLGSLCNSAGNTVFGAALMLALPEENRSAILGFVQSASVGGMALSAVLYGVLGDIFPLYLVFAAGSLVSLVPMLYLFFHRRVRAFVLKHDK